MRTRTREPRTATRWVPRITILGLALALIALLAAVSTTATAASGPSLWVSASELAGLPTSGSAWEALEDAADERLRPKHANLAERTDHNTGTLAAALVAARLDSDAYRAKVRDALVDVMDQAPDLDDVLAACRRLGSYVIAADLIGLSSFDPAVDGRFRTWLDDMLILEYTEGWRGSIVDVHERRPNNWGTHAGASRIAAAAYLGDREEVARAAAVFKGYLGDRSAYAGFEFGELDWQTDPGRPVGVNPVGATIDGHPVDGVLPDDQRRSGGFDWPPPQENYVWEALQGAVVQAQLLSRLGYDAWQWQDRALLRAVTWLHEQADYPAEGDDEWIPWLVNAAYGTDFPTGQAVGKSMGFTSWTHGSSETRSR